MGDKITISGNIEGSIVNIKSSLRNVQQSVGAIPSNDAALVEKLKALIDELSQKLQEVPAENKEQAEAVAQTAQALIEAAKPEQPNKTMLQIAGEGLKQAAGTLAEVVPALATIATQIVTTVMQMKGLMG